MLAEKIHRLEENPKDQLLHRFVIDRLNDLLQLREIGFTNPGRFNCSITQRGTLGKLYQYPLDEHGVSLRLALIFSTSYEMSVLAGMLMKGSTVVFETFTQYQEWQEDQTQ